MGGLWFFLGVTPWRRLLLEVESWKLFLGLVEGWEFIIVGFDTLIWFQGRRRRRSLFPLPTIFYSFLLIFFLLVWSGVGWKWVELCLWRLLPPSETCCRDGITLLLLVSGNRFLISQTIYLFVLCSKGSFCCFLPPRVGSLSWRSSHGWSYIEFLDWVDFLLLP